METLWQDIRYGARMLLKSPSVSIVATIALALGIGANTAVFSVINAVLLRPLPFPNSERLMSIWETSPATGGQRGSSSYPNFADLRQQNNSFEGMSAFYVSDFVLTGKGDPERLSGAVANANLFQVLGVSPVVGRSFAADDDKPNANGHVVVLSQALFEKRFNSDAGILNQPIDLNGKVYTVIGVMPHGFEFPIQNEPAQLWTTVADDYSGDHPITEQRGAHFLNVIGRLKSGVTREQAGADMDVIGARLEQQYPDTNKRHGVSVEPALLALVGDVRPALLILLGAVACVLLIACANVANLLLARAASRNKEMAIRTALGASRRRVVRQLLTESVMLSLAGGGLGLLLAVWWSDLLVVLGKHEIPRAMQVGLDWTVLGFTFGVSILTGMIFGLVPALHSAKTGLTGSLKEGGRGSGEAARSSRLRGALIVAELAIAVVLLTGAGLLLKSLWRLEKTNPGFHPEQVQTFTVALPETKYTSERQSRFFEDLKANTEATPGVEAASSVMPLPLSGDRFSISFEIEGRPVPRSDQPSADYFAIGVGYFRTMGIPLIKGRDFNEHDQHPSPPVIIVTQTFARQYFPNEDPIGKHIKPGIATFGDDRSVMREIVGVVGDVRSIGLDRVPRAAYYVPQTQTPFNQMVVVVRTANDPHAIIPTVTRKVAEADRDVPVFSVKTMNEYLGEAVSAPRFNTTLLAIFAAVALVLTIVGLYGVMSYSVAQRTGEIGIRMALGAQSSDVLRLVVGQGIKLVLIGLVLGVAGALAVTRVIESLLFSVGTKDPITFVAVAGLLSCVALLACYLPARRATKVDPLVALRYE
jgi:putative ABC transport system permease protein